ncbi:MAG: HAMP domain-containing sensor histidine kinase [Planctomycetota bacterium]
MNRWIAKYLPRLSSARTALFLYVLLVVLPAVVFGGLLWRQLRTDQERQLDEIPRKCEDAAERLALSCSRRVRELLARQHDLPFEHFEAEYFSEESGELLRHASPLALSQRPPGVLGWFSVRATGPESAEPAPITVLRGTQSSIGEVPPENNDPIEQFIRDIVREEFVDADPFDIMPARDSLFNAREEEDGWGEVRRRQLRSAILNLVGDQESACRTALENEPTLIGDIQRDFHVKYLEIRVIEAGQQQLPWVIAYREVVMEGLRDMNLPMCMDTVNTDVLIVQGVVLDPEWLFVRLPKQEAIRVLDRSLRFAPPGEPRDNDLDMHYAFANVLGPLDALLHEWPEAAKRGNGVVVGDKGVLRREFGEQNAWFGGVALVLTISMAIGIRLLLSSIRRSRVEAERTRNFVASVTHELRTPIAAVKLYGEMLSDGWIQDEKRRGEYLQRIVHESDRLDGLVDRVLLRRKLSDADHTPHGGDLNSEVEQLRPGLEMVGGGAADDIRFELTRDLPKVLLLHEGVHVVLTNLVENARKYAPVAVAGGDGVRNGNGSNGSNGNGHANEPILVRTRMSRKGRVLLEVLDRGPGIPEEDREKIFQAFLRLGDEQTRSTKGTGLGLHLVALQAKAMKAQVRALPRQGGGTVFQVLFTRA